MILRTITKDLATVGRRTPDNKDPGPQVPRPEPTAAVEPPDPGVDHGTRPATRLSHAVVNISLSAWQRSTVSRADRARAHEAPGGADSAALLRKLMHRDREVRTEAATYRVRNTAFELAPHFDYEIGPDGHRYAVAGELTGVQPHGSDWVEQATHNLLTTPGDDADWV